MSPQELAAQCANAINRSTVAGGNADDATIVVVLPKKLTAPPKFPRRALLCVNPKGERVYRMSAQNVLAWLVANAAVNVMAITPGANA